MCCKLIEISWFHAPLKFLVNLLKIHDWIISLSVLFYRRVQYNHISISGKIFVPGPVSKYWKIENDNEDIRDSSSREVSFQEGGGGE